MLTQSKCAACSSCPSFKAAEWQGIPADGLQMIEKYKKERVLRPGELVHSQGDPCEGIYCVRSGLIGERRVDCDGRSVLVRLYHAGLSLGYREVLSNSTCANSVEALRESRVCFLGRSVINELMDRYPVFCREFLQRSISDCRQMEDELVEAKTLGVRYRFLHLLLEFYRRFGVHDAFRGHELDIPLARQDLASLLGTAPETISRMIRQLESDGLVHFHGHRVHFPDLELVSRQLHAVAA